MKKCLIGCLILTIAHRGVSQVVISLQLIPQGLTTKDQLWNLSLMNSEGQQMYVRVEMQMTDVATNQRVLTAVTRDFILPKGVKQLRALDVGPVTYNTVNSSYAVDAATNGLLPVGVFNICYSVVRSKGETLADECDDVEVEPLSPPSLVLPYDQDAIDVSRPQFTWTPPAPMNLFNRLSYDLSLVEVLPTQTPSDAIIQNIPILLLHDVYMTSVQYPQSVAELDTAKTYAWRIKAKNNGLAVANSETWTFKVVKKYSDGKLKASQYQYAKMSRQPDASFIIATEKVHIEFDNDYNDPSVDIEIADITRSRRITVLKEIIPVRLGANFTSIDLEKTSGMINQHMYLLELTNAKNEKWFIKFRYHK